MALVLAGLNGVPRDGAGLVLFTEARGTGSRGDSIAGAVKVPLSRSGGGDSRALNLDGGGSTTAAAWSMRRRIPMASALSATRCSW